MHEHASGGGAGRGGAFPTATDGLPEASRAERVALAEGDAFELESARRADVPNEPDGGV